MTSIPLSELTAPEIRRDQWDRYLIVPPEGGKPTGYTRCTTVAKELDKGGGLAPWASTMTAVGMIARRGLRAKWEALIAQSGGDPWYSSEANKKAAKKLVEECKAAGGGEDRKEIGTALHALTALADAGRTLPHLTEETERDLAAYANGLAAAGIEIMPGLIEFVVVLDELRVAGQVDRVVRVPGFALPLIADLKTGADIEMAMLANSVQLAGYSRADAIYRQGPADDGSQDERLPMPEVDQAHGLIMWLNAGTARLELRVVDIAAGWEAFTFSMWAREWRKRSVSRPLEQPAPVDVTSSGADSDLTQLLEASLAALEPVALGSGFPHAENLGDGPELESESDAAFLAQIRTWLQHRIDAIGNLRGQPRDDLMRAWPSDLPTLKGCDDHNAEQLSRIERICDEIEARHQIPFGASRPVLAQTEARAIGRVLRMFPNSSITDDKGDDTT